MPNRAILPFSPLTCFLLYASNYVASHVITCSCREVSILTGLHWGERGAEELFIIVCKF